MMRTAPLREVRAGGFLYRLDPSRHMKDIARSIVDPHGDGEFIGAGTSEQVSGAQLAEQAARNGDDEFVAAKRPHAFVDPAEPREVDQDQRIAVCTVVADAQFETLDKPCPVGEARQRVGQNLASKRFARANFAGALDQRDEHTSPEF